MGYTVWPDGPSGDVVSEVYRERRRQDELQRQGKFPFTCATPNGLTDAEKLGVLAEEFGEVAQLVCCFKIPDFIPDASLESASRREQEATPEYRAKLREELIQVAAVCVAWAESL